MIFHHMAHAEIETWFEIPNLIIGTAYLWAMFVHTRI